MTLTTGFCPFCLAKDNCAISMADKVVRHHCVYFKQNEGILNDSFEPLYTDLEEAKTGLCATCNNFDICNWHNSETVILQCEHYQ